MFDNVVDLDFNVYYINELFLVLIYLKCDCFIFFFIKYRVNIFIGINYVYLVVDLYFVKKNVE